MHVAALSSLLETVAPTVASALAGPLAGSAVTALETAIGHPATPGAPVPDRLATVAATLEDTPTQRLALQQAELSFTLQMASVAVSDRSNARAREVTVKDSTPRILAYVLSVGALGIGTCALFHGLSTDSTLTGIILGYVFSEAKTASAYYFGSSPTSVSAAETSTK